MRILRAVDHRRMPWKNGAGVTTEIAVSPDGAGLDEFGWRISMAAVATDGPFSIFAGVDRTLAVLEGEGVVLSVDGQPDVTLMRHSLPFAVPADRSTSARLISGPIVDLNVMTRRGAFDHRVERLAPGRSTTDRGLTVVFCAAGSGEISSTGGRVRLGKHDAAILDLPSEIEARQGAELYVVTLRRASVVR